MHVSKALLAVAALLPMAVAVPVVIDPEFAPGPLAITIPTPAETNGWEWPSPDPNEMLTTSNGRPVTTSSMHLSDSATTASFSTLITTVTSSVPTFTITASSSSTITGTPTTLKSNENHSTISTFDKLLEYFSYGTLPLSLPAGADMPTSSTVKSSQLSASFTTLSLSRPLPSSSAVRPTVTRTVDVVVSTMTLSGPYATSTVSESSTAQTSGFAKTIPGESPNLTPYAITMEPSTPTPHFTIISTATNTTSTTDTKALTSSSLAGYARDNTPSTISTKTIAPWALSIPDDVGLGTVTVISTETVVSTTRSVQFITQWHISTSSYFSTATLSTITVTKELPVPVSKTATVTVTVGTEVTGEVADETRSGQV